KVPAAILGLLAGIGAYFGLGLFLPDLLVLSGNPLVIGPLDASGSLFDAVVDRASSFREVGLADVVLVLASAVTLSVLLSIDTLKTGVVLDALTHSRHDSNRELMAQGAGNAVAALTGGMPGAGTMGPTLVNVTSGGRSPLSGFAEGALVLVTFVALGGLIAWVPIGALAGILLVIAFRMFDWSAFGLLRHPETRLDFFVIAAVVVVAESVGLIEASVLGVALAILLFIRDQIRGSVILRKRDLREVESKTRRLAAARDLLQEHGDQGVLVELQDNLFFGTTDQLFTELETDLRTRRFLLLDMRRVDSMDYTAGHLFHQMQERLEQKGGQLLFCGMPSGLPTGRDVERYLATLGLVRTAGGIPILETQDSALEWMEDRILEATGYEIVRDDRALELSEIELFREFDDEALATLESIVEPVHLDAGQKLFSQGDGGDQVFLVRRGTVHILLPLPGGKRHHLATLGRGDYFGEMVFLDRGLRSADAEAVADSDLYALSRGRFDQVARTDAVVATKVFARLALLVSKRLRSADGELRALEDR
ncbi:MAG: SLC26A/SulP transporter family protein, partial [Deltaproteobacteria bacterium]|nr:SLC26A/SulP transporter family protein [Deltaproteobacteria bacterium]